MKGILKRDPAAAIAKTQNIRANIALQIAGLVKEREALLLGDDDQALDRLDAEIARLRRACEVHRERIALLEGELRRQEIERLEGRRAAAIAVIERKLAARNAAAVALERAVTDLGEALFAVLDARKAVLTGWPECLPPVAGHELGLAGFNREFAWALHAAGRPDWDRPCAIPAPNDAGRGVVAPQLGIAGLISAEAKTFVDQLKAAPLTLDKGDGPAGRLAA